MIEEHWPKILEKMRTDYCTSNIAFKTWIAPLTIQRIEDQTVYILVTLDGSLDHIEKKFKIPFSICIEEVTGEECEVVFVSGSDAVMENRNLEIRKEKKNLAMLEKAGLNPKYTFDSFIVGSHNNFAHAAALSVAENPGPHCSPLFLYGGVGLGKTHLMHSIAHFILQQDPTKKVLYITSEVFTNELIEAIKNGKRGNESSMSSFRDKYRNIDVLLIDDIQFIIGKESTQDEFFHTFNHLHMAGKQIIISSDRPPKDIETLEARLRTRFEWGLLAHISSPDYETRMAILKSKEENSSLKKYHIPDDVLEYIANHIKSNIRELEGSLNKLIYLANLEEKPIDITLAAEALKDMISSEDLKKISPDLIIDIVADHFNVSAEEIKGKKRRSEIVLPRHIAMYLCRTMTDSPHKLIADIFGGRDRTAVIHAEKKISNELEDDEGLKNTVSILEKKINPL